MKYLFSILLAMLSLTAMAQEATFEKQYVKASAVLNINHFKSECSFENYEDNRVFAGYGLGMIYGLRITEPQDTRCAVYFESGVEAMYGFFNDDDVDSKFRLFAMTAPVDFVFKFRLGNDPTDFSKRLFFFFGASPKVNLIARVKQKVALKVEGPASFFFGQKLPTHYDYIEDEIKVNLFDKDEVGDGYAAERLQIAANVGVGFETGRWQVAYKFSKDYPAFRSFKYALEDASTHTMNHVLTVSYTLFAR